MLFKYTDLLIFSFGFFAQFLFFSRNVVQWFKSEKAGKVLSPVLYWQISLIASVAMMVYGIFRTDPAIILGQFITFFIYIRNLQLQKAWKKIPLTFRATISTMPFICLFYMLLSGNFTAELLFSGEKMPVWLMFFGIAAQLVFTFRFVFQWIISEKNNESSIPVGFWIFSITGAAMTIFYALMRLDPVLLVSNLGGLAMYTRNLTLHFSGKGIFELLPFDFRALKEKVIQRKQKGASH